MLDIIRNLVSSIFGKVLLAIMVLSFALWGVGDILSSGNSQLAAKIGDEKITLDEFYIKFQETVRNYNQNTGSNLNLRDAYEIQLHNILLQELVYEKMVNDYANKKKLYINNDSLKLIITNLPEFQNVDKTFSNTKYKTFILNNFPNEDVFLKEIENTIFQGILFENFDVSKFINDSIIDLLYNYEGEKRTITYFLLDSNQVKIDVTDLLLRNFYSENSANYITPEKLIVDVIEIDIENFKNQENIRIEEVVNYYNNNIEQYTKEENRDIQFLRFSSKDDASKFYEVISSSDINIINDYMNERDLKFSTINNFTGNEFTEEITKKIFSLDESKVSNPIDYEGIGYFVFKVLKVNEKEITPFESVKNEIINDLALEAAYQDFDETINLADEMLINDYSFEEISQSAINLKVRKNVDFRELENKLGDNYSQPNYKLPIGYVSEIIINNNAAIIYNIKNRLEPSIPDLTKIKEKVESDFIKNQQKSRLSSQINDILNNISFKNIDSFKEYASQNNYIIKNLNKITRSSVELSSETIAKAFKLNPIVPFEVTNIDGALGIGVIKEIIEPKDQISDELFNSIKNNVKNNFNSSLSEIIGSEIIKKSSFEIYNQNIDQLFM